MSGSSIGLSGFAQTGKTTAANYLQEMYGFKRLHIAEPIRAMLSVLMRANGIPSDMIGRYLEGDLKDGVVIPEFGKTSRDMQITLGTPWGRNLVNNDLWVNTWRIMAEGYENVMNDSVRFLNEEETIKNMGGLTILIRRKGTGPVQFKDKWGKALYKWTGLLWGAHDSERPDRLDPDFIVDNDGSVEELYAQLDGIMMVYGIEKKNAVTPA